MSKRDTDTEIWSEDWFLNLSDAEMLFWNYIKDKCDHAGFWRPNFKIFETITGRRINQKEFFEKVNADKERLILIENGRWFITGFISFQYCGKLNLNNRFHKSVMETFRKNLPEAKSTDYGFDVTLTSIRPQVDLNKEQETKNKKEGGVGETKYVCSTHVTQGGKEEIFDIFRKKYPGSKRGLKTEYENFYKKHKDNISVLPLLLPALENQIVWCNEMSDAGMFVPEWKNLPTWINQRCWEMEKPEIRIKRKETTEEQCERLRREGKI